MLSGGKFCNGACPFVLRGEKEMEEIMAYKTADGKEYLSKIQAEKG